MMPNPITGKRAIFDFCHPLPRLREFVLQNNLKILAAISIVALVAACDTKVPEPLAAEPLAPEPVDILVYCDGKSDRPVTLTGDDGSKIEATLSYRGFYRINLKAETLEAKLAGNGEFLSQCSSGRPCKLVSSKSEIRFEDHGRRWENKVIDVTYLFERNTGHFYRKSEVNGPNGAETEHAFGSCKPMDSIDQQLF